MTVKEVSDRVGNALQMLTMLQEELGLSEDDNINEKMVDLFFGYHQIMGFFAIEEKRKERNHGNSHPVSDCG